MDFIPKREYILALNICVNMYNKHAVWCQCVLIGMFVLTAASLLSIQNITFDTDIYWSIVMFFVSVIEFIVAEHAPVAGISVDRWMQMGRIEKTTVYVIMLTWSTLAWQPSWIQWAHIPVGILAGFVLKNPKFVLAGAVVARMTTTLDITLVAMLVLLAINIKKTNVINKSIVSYEHKKTIAIKAMSIFLEATILWLMRCEQRFPHVIRWRPLVAATLSIIFAALWCEYNVMDTVGTDRDLIVRKGHGIAASLRAARACPVCTKCLTSLDMESSFSGANAL